MQLECFSHGSIGLVQVVPRPHRPNGKELQMLILPCLCTMKSAKGYVPTVGVTLDQFATSNQRS